MLDAELLKILVCPETKQPVHLADGELVARLNDRIRSNQVVNRAGDSVTQLIDAALVREDGQLAYPVRSDIPVMLVEEGIPL